MEKYILYFFLITFSITVLNAQESVKVDIEVLCSNSKNLPSKLSITISSNKLNLTQDAIQDNLGGYVDIPEDRYYLKTDTKVYHLNGVVENDYKNSTKRFTSYINNNSKKFITPKELHSLKNSENLKFIQKINLEESNPTNNSKTKTTTNTLNVYFNSSLFNVEYQKCEETITKPEENLYLQVLLLALLIFVILYFFKKKF